MGDIATILDKAFNVTPATEGTSPFAKQHAIATPLRKLRRYIVVPAFQASLSYNRRLVFQWNYTFDQNFYITNKAQLQGQNQANLVEAGCLCIKYRVGTTVYRYKLLDDDLAVDWSYFTEYTDQLIKKNFCVEFWCNPGATFHIPKVANAFSIQTSILINPSFAEQTDTINNIPNPASGLNDLGSNLPMALPYAQANQVWLTN